MRKTVVCILLILLVVPFGCTEKKISENEALAVTEKLAEIMFTSDSERFGKHKQTDFYVEDPSGKEKYGYESLFMYIPLYEEICTENAIGDLSKEEPFCMLTVDRYIDSTDYDKCVFDKITFRTTEETDEHYIINFTVHAVFLKGELPKNKTVDFEVYVRKTDHESGDGKRGQIDIVNYEDGFVFLDV